MKINILAVMTLLAALAMPGTAGAQTKVSLSLKRQANEVLNGEPQTSLSKQGELTTSMSTQANGEGINVHAVLADDMEIPTKQLSDMGIKVTFTTKNIVGLLVPAESVSKLDDLKEFESFNTPMIFSLDNNLSRIQEHVTEAQSPVLSVVNGLPHTYTGVEVLYAE